MYEAGRVWWSTNASIEGVIMLLIDVSRRARDDLRLRFGGFVCDRHQSRRLLSRASHNGVCVLLSVSVSVCVCVSVCSLVLTRSDAACSRALLAIS